MGSRALTGKDGAAMLLLLLLGVVPILHVFCSEEVIVDTDACLRGAKARHGDDPNDELDSFLACVLARLDAVETSDKEVLNLKSQLAAIEDMPSFGKNGFKHNLAKRQAEENTEEDMEEGMEEGRGWKNKEKKRKNKFDTDLMEEDSGAKEAAEDSSETETSDKAAEAPFTSGLQFSAYSPQPQPRASYNNNPEPSYTNPPRRADQILYGLDSYGKPVYMDAADVAELLGTPKAKKAMLTFLSGSQETANPIPSRLQEHFRPPAPRPPLPEWR